MIISRPTVGSNEPLELELKFEHRTLSLSMRAMRKLRVVEVQGPKHLLVAYGVTKPPNFATRWFADDVEVPPEMMDGIAVMNQLDFRWGCDIPIAAHGRAVITLPTTVDAVQPIDLGIFDVVYEYTIFFGLVRRKYAAKIAVGSRENRKPRQEEHAA